MEPATRFDVPRLRRFVCEVLLRAGVAEDCAATVADCLLDAQASGVASHGVSRLPIYVKRIEAGLVEKENRCRVVQESPSTALIDAGNTLGAPAGRFAMEVCVRKARETGCCFAAVRGSNHFGTAAFYTRMAADAGMLGFACTNLTGKIAPYGAAEPYMGTNPVSLAVPSGEVPFVLDMTPSVAALGKLILAQQLGESIPLGWALDAEGKPTTDPAAGRKGSLIPIAGPKGSGLALAVELLCGVLTGAGTAPHLHDLYALDAPQGVGHFMGAIDVSRFLPVDAFRAAVDAMAAEVKGLRRAEGVDEILLPGERAERARVRSRTEGVAVPEAVCAELTALGARYGVAL